MKPKPHYPWLHVLTFGLPLKARMILGTLVPIIGIATYFSTSYLAQKRLAAMTHEILDERIEMMQSAAQIKQALVSYDDSLFRYLAVLDGEQLRESRRQKEIATREIAHLVKLSKSSTLSERLEVLSTESQQYFQDAHRLLEYVQSHAAHVRDIGRRSETWTRGGQEREMELAFLSKEGQARLIRVFSLCDEIITVNRMALEQAQGDMQDLLLRTKASALWLSGISIGALLLVMAGFALSVLFPLGELMSGVRKIEEGDLDVQIPVVTTDEVGELTDAFNRATRTIRDQRDQLWRESITDHLTGAYNQRHFRKILTQEIERAKRATSSLALMMVDIDHFKTYNDTHGHEFGNEVIRRVVHIVRETLRQTDLVARYGGDELAILLPDTEAAHAHVLARRLLEEVSAMRIPSLQGEGEKISVSIGGACYPSNATMMEELIRKADDALYAAKRGGRARVHWVNSSTPVFQL